MFIIQIKFCPGLGEQQRLVYIDFTMESPLLFPLSLSLAQIN